VWCAREASETSVDRRNGVARTLVERARHERSSVRYQAVGSLSLSLVS
jgi:hypothetical protein